MKSEKVAALFGQTQTKLAIASVSAVFFLLLAIVFASNYWQTSAQKQAENRIKSELTRLAETDDPKREKKLISLSRLSRDRLGYSIPELQYWRLLNLWEKRLYSFQKLLSIEDNSYLNKDLDKYRNRAEENLNKLKTNCTESIKDLEGKSTDSLWKFYNLRGCTAVLTAYLAIEFEENQSKGASALKEAISDFKQAMRLVDSSSLSHRERLVPRWNMEIITGKGQLRQLSRRQYQSKDARKVFEQLEVVPPEEFGGYAPGVPMDTQVEK